LTNIIALRNDITLGRSLRWSNKKSLFWFEFQSALKIGLKIILNDTLIHVNSRVFIFTHSYYTKVNFEN